MEKNPKILVVDDEPGQRTLLGDFLKDSGYPIQVASSGKEALGILLQENDVTRLVLTDLSMPELDGIELIRRSKESRPDLDFIVITAHATVESAIGALKAGALDYLTKPLALDEVLFRVRKIFSLRDAEERVDRLERENRDLRGSIPPVAESPAMKALIAELDKISKTDASVLLIGETGVGKEVLSQYVHEHSTRAKGSFIAVNCSAIPENLVESEFFGFEKGAFTGADRRNIGFFERADGGTLFLDEIGELDLRLQPKILRVIEDRKVRRVAGSADIPVNVRFIAATNRDLKQMVVEKKFRDDLYYRLNVVQLVIPPLRERKEDIPALVHHMIKRYCSRLKTKIDKVEPEYLEILSNYSFPGNVRELANVVERSLIYQTGGRLDSGTLPSELKEGATILDLPLGVTHSAPTLSGTLAEQLGVHEKKLIEQALESDGHDIDRAAVRLNVARSTLYAKMNKYGLKC